jgi:hypothetical protein
MTKAIRDHFVPALLAVIVFFVTLPFVETVMRYYTRLVPPIDWHSVKVISKSVSPGDELELIYIATVNKQCPSELRSFLIAEDGSAPVRFPPRLGGYTSPSMGKPVDIPVKVLIPQSGEFVVGKLTSGKYTYRTIGLRYCPDGMVQDVKIPDATFYLNVNSVTG